jgi:hypothetical protein
MDTIGKPMTNGFGSSTFVLTGTCEHCDNFHTGQCPRIKAIEYRQDGSVRRIEYFDMYSAVSVPFVQTEPHHLRPPYTITCTSTGGNWSATTIGDPPGSCSTGSAVSREIDGWLTLAQDALAKDWNNPVDAADWDGVANG